MLVGAEEGYRIWAAGYDRGPNPLLALETRVLPSRLEPLDGLRFLDAAAGTGRWMKYAASQGANVVGIDLSPSMLAVAVGDADLVGRLLRGDVRRLPFTGKSFDLTLCSFALGYVRNAWQVLNELARVSRRVIVSDLHPAALDAGWTRGFRAGGEVYEIENFRHAALEAPAGMRCEWSLDAFLGEPERATFESAGRGTAFEAAARIPAVRAVCWS